jgi:hypothetical protein
MTQADSKLLLPHYGGKDDLERVVQYLRTKPTGAVEADVSRTLGAKTVDPRKFDFYDLIGFFTRGNGLFRLTDRGIEYLRADEGGKREMLRDAIRNFMPYHAILDWAFHNKVTSLDADSLKHEWASKFAQVLDLSNDYRLASSPVPFFALLEMAGLGTFVIGRRGSKSRIEFNIGAVEQYLSRAAAVSDGDAGEGVVEDTPGNVDGKTPNVSTSKRTAPPSVPTGGYTFNVPVMGKVAVLSWPEPAMSPAEWEKFKRVGDAMFLD